MLFFFFFSCKIPSLYRSNQPLILPRQHLGKYWQQPSSVLKKHELLKHWWMWSDCSYQVPESSLMMCSQNFLQWPYGLFSQDKAQTRTQHLLRGSNTLKPWKQTSDKGNLNGLTKRLLQGLILWNNFSLQDEFSYSTFVFNLLSFILLFNDGWKRSEHALPY